jgi:LysR family transcriptional regulator, glycine cleavage system transcriptional activator
VEVNRSDDLPMKSPAAATAAMSAKPGRPRLPALESLRVFEAAARHVSFTKAARELSVTPAAVSQRVQSLEAELRLVLFRRLTRRLELTRDGERLAAGVREALERIARALGDLDGRADLGPLTVSMLPSFAARWLIPRLQRFRLTHPDIEIRISADDRSTDLWAADGPDLAIRYGLGRYPGLATFPLMPDSIGPVCTPELLARHAPARTVDALLAMPLLHDSVAERDDSGTCWQSWLEHLGFARDDRRLAAGLRFSHAHFAIQAALLGQGVALARTSLAADDLATGRLVRAWPEVAPTNYRYFLLCRPETADRRKVACFRDWLVGEAQSFIARTAGESAR